MAGKAVLLSSLLLAGTASAEESFGSWDVTCSDDKICLAEQVNQDKTGETVMRTDIAPVDGGLVLQVKVPAKVRLTEGPWLTVDGVYISDLKFENCANGCLARVALPSARAAALTQGKQAMITVTGLDGRRIGIPLLPTGLSDAITSIKSKK